MASLPGKPRREPGSRRAWTGPDDAASSAVSRPAAAIPRPWEPGRGKAAPRTAAEMFPEAILLGAAAHEPPTFELGSPAKLKSPAEPRRANLNAPDEYIPDQIPTAPKTPGTSKLRPILIEATEEEMLAIDAAELEEDLPTKALLAAPPWLASLVVHAAGLIVLGLIFLPDAFREELRLKLRFAEEYGEQLDDQTFQFVENDPAPNMAFARSELTKVDDPLSAPPDIPINLNGNQMASAEPSAPSIGIALHGREEGMKQALLLAYGGNETTEASVMLALEWLARQQLRGGSWSLEGPYSDGSANENELAATAMALLAFQGAGFTHQTGRSMLDEHGKRKQVDFQSVVNKGWKAMLRWQSPEGAFSEKVDIEVRHHRLYSQAQATIAICELYGMSKDPTFRKPAQKAVDYAISIQDRLGGWRYDPGNDSDTSVTGWFVMALQSARMAGLAVPSEVFQRVSKYLDLVTDDGGSRYGYLPDYASNETMTAEALLCRQYLGWRQNDERLVNGVRFVAANPIQWDRPNTYYWYYATQVMHHMEGTYWDDWNRVMRQEIPARQLRDGKERGSWAPDGDPWGAHGGRLYMTCLSTYMLEVYYRHLPIYSEVYKF